MSDQTFDVQRSRRQATIIIWVVIIGLLAIPASIGIAVARATHGNPVWDSRIHRAIGLFFMATGLFGLVRLAAYGPKSPTQNRVQASVMNSGMALLGVTQIANDSVVETPLAILAAVLVLAAAFRRPRRYF
jgi:hypothetical protein